MGVLDKIDAIVVYVMQSEQSTLPLMVVHGEARPGDLVGMFAKLLGTPSFTGPGLDLKGNHEQIRCVLFKDGSVTSMTEAEFQAALKLPRNAAFAAALKKAGG
jgi:hypothetical protein